MIRIKGEYFSATVYIGLQKKTLKNIKNVYKKEISFIDIMSKQKGMGEKVAKLSGFTLRQFLLI